MHSAASWSVSDRRIRRIRPPTPIPRYWQKVAESGRIGSSCPSEHFVCDSCPGGPSPTEMGDRSLLPCTEWAIAHSHDQNRSDLKSIILPRSTDPAEWLPEICEARCSARTPESVIDRPFRAPDGRADCTNCGEADRSSSRGRQGRAKGGGGERERERGR